MRLFIYLFIVSLNRSANVASKVPKEEYRFIDDHVPLLLNYPWVSCLETFLTNIRNKCLK